MHGVFVHPALLQEKTKTKVRCHVCERRCEIIAGGMGWCRTRYNEDGNLLTNVYGAVSSLSVNPIEKKPLYHFYPGSTALTCGSWSCNFGCPWCQNWHISKNCPPETGQFISPEQFIERCLQAGCQGTSISFNEPTLSLEWALPVFRLARQHSLYNTFVTNGYLTPEALSLLVAAGLDAINVDIKGEEEAVWRYCKGIEVEKVWAFCKLVLSMGVHLEVTTLVIPTVNDSNETLNRIARRLANELSPTVPWHVTGYSPAYRFYAPPTPVATLELGWQAGKQAGLEFVYTGNLPGHPHDNTYCPACDKLLIKRQGYTILQNVLLEGSCPQCKRLIPGRW